MAIAGFVIVLAATGAVLPFSAELQRMLVPGHTLAPPAPGSQPFDWVTLHEIAERSSGGIATTMPLHQDSGQAIAYSVVAHAGRHALASDTIWLDLYTGQVIDNGRDPPFAARIVPFIESLHFTLALGDWGAWLLGVAALAWTLDCFVGFYLTLPAGPHLWWRRWGKSWTIKRPIASSFRLTFDWHRASGLWCWPMLFVFAWSGVAFNLSSVYAPIMHGLTGYVAEAPVRRPERTGPPDLDWAKGLAAARTRAREATQAAAVSIERERELRFLARERIYALALRTSRDRSDDGANSWVRIDADTGDLLGVDFPTGGKFGNSIDLWLGLLHEAAVFGLPYRIFVSTMGVAIVALTVTGVMIWMRKTSRRRRGGQGKEKH